MPSIPHDPDRARRIHDCMVELRKRHTLNPRRMYARRVEHFAGLEIPVVANPHWFHAVARRFAGKETI